MRKLLYILPAGIILLGLTLLVILKFTGGHSLDRRSARPDKSLEQFFAEAQQNTRPSLLQTEPRTVTFLAVGDISLSRGIAGAIQKNKDPLVPFKGIDKLLRSTDFNFGNLETPFSKSDTFTAKETLVFNAPKPNVVGLKTYKFQVLNLANNHALDQGLEGITTTTKILDDNDLLHMGTGHTLDQAWQPAIIEKNGIKIGFIGASYSSINDGGKTINNYVARIEDLDNLQSAIKNLQFKVDFIVVTMHAGTEYVRKPNQSQIDFAHAAIDAGADIVIGAHPHWVQDIEEYKGKKIYYSLGNFIFDQYWSEETKKGLVLKITLSKIGPICPTSPIGPINNCTTNDLQPSASPAPAPILQSIEEIPIYIKDNCCPVIDAKNSDVARTGTGPHHSSDVQLLVSHQIIESRKSGVLNGHLPGL